MDEKAQSGGLGTGNRGSGGEYMRRFGLWVLIALALIFLTVAYSMVYDSLIGRVTPTIIVREGTVERFASCNALVIRDERLVLATAPGSFNPVAIEGERLAKGGLAARIGGLPEPAEAVDVAQKLKDEADLALLLLEKADAALSDARIFLSAKEAELAIYLNRGDSRSVERLKMEVQDSKDRVAAAIAAKVAASKEYDAKLEAASDAPSSVSADAELGGVKVRTSRQAVVSYEWDGLEDELSPANLTLLDMDYSISKEATQNARKPGDALLSGDIVFREVGSLSTDVLLYLQGVDPEFLLPGSMHRLRFTRMSSEKVAAKLKASKTADDGTVRAYLSLDRYVTSMTSMRTVEVELLLESYSGLIVPARAISTGSGKSVVRVMRQDRFIEVEVEVLGIVDGEAAVKSNSLRQGDKVRYDG